MMGEKYNLSDKKTWRLQNSRNAAILQHKPSGARVRCHGSDPKRAHGLRSFLALLDEPAQWMPGTADKMRSAIRTGLGKVAGSRLVALGTKPRNPDHWFRVMLDGKNCGYAQVHAAGEKDKPFHRRVWRRANPSFDHLPSLQAQIEVEAADAKTDPAELASFQAHRLNTGTSEVLEAILFDAEKWQQLEGDAETSGPYVLGIDLGGSAAMSAASCYFPATGALRSIACFCAEPSLAERGLRDGVGDQYVLMHRRGEIFIAGTHVNDTGALLQEVLDRYGRPAALVCDRFKADDLREVLHERSFPVVPLIERGAGFKDGDSDVRAFRKALLTGRVVPERSLLMRAAMSEARTVSDIGAANVKLAKASEGQRRSRARDDCVASSIIAIAEGVRRFPDPSRVNVASGRKWAVAR